MSLPEDDLISTVESSVVVVVVNVVISGNRNDEEDLDDAFVTPRDFFKHRPATTEPRIRTFSST